MKESCPQSSGLYAWSSTPPPFTFFFLGWGFSQTSILCFQVSVLLMTQLSVLKAHLSTTYLTMNSSAFLDCADAIIKHFLPSSSPELHQQGKQYDLRCRRCVQWIFYLYAYKKFFAFKIFNWNLLHAHILLYRTELFCTQITYIF